MRQIDYTNYMYPSLNQLFMYKSEKEKKKEGNSNINSVG